MSAKTAKKVTMPKEVTAGNKSAGNTEPHKNESLKNEPCNIFADVASSANSERSQKVTPEASGGNKPGSPVVTSEIHANTKNRSAPLTEVDVAAVYMKLIADGITPTVRLIYGTLQRGSLRTINKFFKPIDHDYRKQQIEASEQPNNLSDFEDIMIRALSKACYETKVKRYENKILALNSVIEKLEDSNTEEQMILCNDKEILQKDLSAAQTVIEEINNEKAELQNRLYDALNENTKLKNAAKESMSDLKHYRELVRLIIRSSRDPDLPKTLVKKIDEVQ